MTTNTTTGHPLPYDLYRETIEHETMRFAALVRDIDPARPVPSCPGWTLADLTRHVGSVHRWFSTLLSRLVQEPPVGREVDLGLPDDPRAYADWLTAGVPGVAAVLRDTEPGAPMWAWGEDQHARFWARRMLFETLVHRTDAERAVGAEPDIDAALATDGVDEFLVNLPHAGTFAPGVTKIRSDGETLVFRCVGRGGTADEEWPVRLDPDGFRLLRPDHDGTGGRAPHTATATATVEGQAADVLLLLYGRRSYREPVFEVTGKTAVLDHWFAHTAF
ncbi:maleylpyruvate isomerase family mycothiol-dependent enzyme [Streptomyces sp. NPDC048606]|uniref:maleylpyruvate isomerase family mycothiol-dependent enzyme n=1 Tax=Streptomyces sp. NPDC048606 TaxID=3154726 RepID=UPI00342C3E6C